VITKKHDWQKGKWAIGIKVITSTGATLEYDCGHLTEREGKAAYNKIMKALGMKGTSDD